MHRRFRRRRRSSGADPQARDSGPQTRKRESINETRIIAARKPGKRENPRELKSLRLMEKQKSESATRRENKFAEDIS